MTPTLKIFFGSLACDYILESGRDIQDVARAIPKTPANQFSKWRQGKWTYIAEPKLVQLIDVIAGRDREKRVNLAIAYAIDMTPGIFRPLIKIEPVSGTAEGQPALTGERWSPSLRAKLEAIGRAYARDDDFMRMADQLGKWAETINRRAEKKD